MRELVGSRELLLRPREVLGPLAGRFGDARLKGSRLQRARAGRPRLRSPETASRRLAQLLGQRLETAGAIGRIVDGMDMRFVLEHELGVAGESAREFVGRAQRLGEGQHGDGVRAADGGRKHGERRAQQIVPGVATRHHPPRRLGVNQRRLRGEAAGLLNPRPKPAQRAEFGDAQQFVGVRREAKAQEPARGLDVETMVGQRAQISEAGGERESRAPAPRLRPPHERRARRRRRSRRRSPPWRRALTSSAKLLATSARAPAGIRAAPARPGDRSRRRRG